jgi:hypothetical protein
VIFECPGHWEAAGCGGMRSHVMLYYGILATLCDPILDRVNIRRTSHEVTALH